MDRSLSGLSGFGEGYQAERGRAVTWGWPVRTIAHARHLHGLIDPPAVATLIDELLRYLLDDGRTTVARNLADSGAGESTAGVSAPTGGVDT